MDLVADLRPFAAMGVAAPLALAPKLARALFLLAGAVLRERPRAALLVGFSELNGRLAVRLRARGVRVLWYAPPQVWAWREGRAPELAAACERLAVVLPFEAPHWRRAGASVEYVGHPALEGLALSPARFPSALPYPVRVALLPGSRGHEIRAHWRRMVGAALQLRARLEHGRRGSAAPNAAVTVTVVRAAALAPPVAARVGDEARAAGFTVVDAPLDVALAGHHVAIAASGTATLECAVLAVPPVIVYRTDPLTYAVARRLVRVPHVGLPNLVLGRGAFPELIQRAATAGAIAEAALGILERRDAHLSACADVRRTLGAGLDARSPSARVAALLGPLLT